jgi:uncharacterized protein (TIGR02231 family)
LEALPLRSSSLSIVTLAALIATVSAPAPAIALGHATPQAASDPIIANPNLLPKPLPIDARISAVTLYQGRALVTRSASLPVATGVWEVRFDDLPASALRDSLQATVSAPAKLLDVRFEEETLPARSANDPESLRLTEALKQSLVESGSVQSRIESINASVRLLDAVATRLSDGAAKDLGGTLDPAVLLKQIGALAEERERLGNALREANRSLTALEESQRQLRERIAALGGESRTRRRGTLLLAIPSSAGDGGSAPIDIRLSYFVSKATWIPNYAIRAAADLSGLVVEYDAVIRQSTGESWEDVALTLSTAQPARAAEPPTLTPIPVDLLRNEESMAYSVAAPREGFPPPPPPPPLAKMPGGPGSDADRAIAEPVVAQNATAASFTLSRAVTIASDSGRDQTTRIATIDLTPTYTYVTRPALDAAAYLRGTTRNTSPYQLLAGRARVFLGGDSIGVAELADVAPGGEFDLWFGADKRIDVERKLVSRNTSTTGLLSKADEIEWQYRVTLKNAIPTATAIEVWDRMPVARNEQITVTLREVSPALANDRPYLANERNQGLLKWSLTMPAATAERGPSSMTVQWTVKLSKPEKTLITPLPE